MRPLAALPWLVLAASACQQQAEPCAAARDPLWHDTPNACASWDWDQDGRVDRHWSAQQPAHQCDPKFANNGGSWSYDDAERYYMSDANVAPDCGVNGWLVVACQMGGITVVDTAQECR